VPPSKQSNALVACTKPVTDLGNAKERNQTENENENETEKIMVCKNVVRVIENR
jgi:hypothetical protein